VLVETLNHAQSINQSILGFDSISAINGLDTI